MMNIVYVPRQLWESDPVNRRGVMVHPERRESLWIHHTAGVDRDDTPNLWTLEGATSYMRRLPGISSQRGLGLDVPYNFVAFGMEDRDRVLIFEGRGFLLSGAHTMGHNRTGFGCSLAGNFEQEGGADPSEILRAVLGWFAGYREAGFENLRALGYHQLVKATACPGKTAIEALKSFAVDRWSPLPRWDIMDDR